MGREMERARLRGLLDAAAGGTSGVLVVHGPVGAGKTALLDDLAAEPDRALTLRARGLEGEAHFAYAALGELLGPALELRDELPDVQAQALGAALALEAGEAMPFAVAAAVLGLLALAAEHRPVLVVVDDLQWADDASRAALLFAARRLGSEGVAMVLGLRDDEGLDAADLGLDTLMVEGLAPPAARELLAGQDLAPPVMEALIAATYGSPLALLEIPALLTDAQRAGTAPLEDPLPLGRSLDRAFRRRLEALPGTARRALVVAACADEARADTVVAALAEADLARDALADAEAAGLVALSARRIEFCHPLVRAAALRLAGPAERRAAHRALAAVLPAEGTARAWQLAAAAEGADPDAARALAAAAADARTRGALDDASRTFARAAELEPDDESRARLLLEASAASLAAARVSDAIAQAHQGAELAQDELLRTDLRCMAARAELRAGLPRGRDVLVREGNRLIATEPARAAMFLLEAATMDMVSGRLKRMIETSERARDAAAEAAPPLWYLATVLIAEAQLALGESAAGDETLAAAEDVLRAYVPGTGPPEVVAMAAHSSLWVERFDRAAAIFDALIDALRQASAVSELIYPLSARSHLHLRLGRWPAALSDASEALRLAEVTGHAVAMGHTLGALAEIEAVLGQDDAARAHGERCVALAQEQGSETVAVYGNGALTLAALGRGEPEEAVERGLAAERAEAGTDHDEPGIVRFLPDLIEALWRVGREDEAAERVARLERQAEGRPGHTWAQAAACRGRGLLSGDGEVDEWFARALALHAATPQPFETARTQLLHGERLRRIRRRSDARRPLREALTTFERLGATGFAARAQAELRATGGQESAAPETASVLVAELTPQELQIAMHAARGMTNREVGAALFLAPKTVEHHLSRCFRKLGIKRRVELAGALAA